VPGSRKLIVNFATESGNGGNLVFGESFKKGSYPFEIEECRRRLYMEKFWV